MIRAVVVAVGALFEACVLAAFIAALLIWAPAILNVLMGVTQ